MTEAVYGSGHRQIPENQWSTGAKDTAIYATTSGTYSVYQVIGTSTSAPSSPITVSVFPAATLFPVGPVCSDVDSILLNVSPQGGIFSGPGVKANYFQPKLAGVNNKGHVITYYTSHFLPSDMCSDSASVRITVLDCTGINSHSKMEEISLSPNPSEDVFLIKQEKNNFTILAVRDLVGHEIESQFYISDGSYAIRLVAPAGVYILTVSLGNQVRHLRLVKQ